MRRGIAILLALIFGAGPLTSALPGAEDASLPPCCRRHGAHHCAMAARIEAMRAAIERDGRTSVSAPDTCPLYPGPTFALLLPAVHALTAQPAPLPALAIRLRALIPDHQAGPSIPSRTHSARGPPAAS